MVRHPFRCWLPVLLLLLIGWSVEAQSEPPQKGESTIVPPGTQAPDDFGTLESWYATPVKLGCPARPLTRQGFDTVP